MPHILNRGLFNKACETLFTLPKYIRPANAVRRGHTSPLLPPMGAGQFALSYRINKSYPVAQVRRRKAIQETMKRVDARGLLKQEEPATCAYKDVLTACVEELAGLPINSLLTMLKDLQQDPEEFQAAAMHLYEMVMDKDFVARLEYVSNSFGDKEELARKLGWDWDLFFGLYVFLRRQPPLPPAMKDVAVMARDIQKLLGNTEAGLKKAAKAATEAAMGALRGGLDPQGDTYMKEDDPGFFGFSCKVRQLFGEETLRQAPEPAQAPVVFGGDVEMVDILSDTSTSGHASRQSPPSDSPQVGRGAPTIPSSVTTNGVKKETGANMFGQTTILRNTPP